MSLISIIDYGSGNIKSVYNAFNYLCEEGKKKLIVTNNYSEIKKSTHIILPGVGAFQSCISGLKQISVREVLEEKVLNDKTPFLGICVGMQMLATVGHENGIFSGLNWIKGEVKKIKPTINKLKIPHMGWNTIKAEHDHPIFAGLPRSPYFYFVHSYAMVCENEIDVLARADYGGPFAAIIGRDNMVGTQFHPEKSQAAGLRLLADFLAWDSVAANI